MPKRFNWMEVDLGLAVAKKAEQVSDEEISREQLDAMRQRLEERFAQRRARREAEALAKRTTVYDDLPKVGWEALQQAWGEFYGR